MRCIREKARIDEAGLDLLKSSAWAVCKKHGKQQKCVAAISMCAEMHLVHSPINFPMLDFPIRTPDIKVSETWQVISMLC